MRLSRSTVALGFLALAVLMLPFADLGFGGHDPWAALLRMGQGFLRPDFSAVEDIASALLSTVAFAICGVTLGATAGFVLAPFWSSAWVRGLSVCLRSVHELFWALFLMQVLGISPAAGVLAIALPYAGIFAKVFAEQIEEADPRPSELLPPRTDALSRFLWARLPLVAPSMRSYFLYRIECGLRSSAVLGFIGLPTLGFQLDTFFRQGEYGAASAIMIVYVVLIASIRLWMRFKAVGLWLIASVVWLAFLDHPPMGSGALWRFLSRDIIPAPLRNGDGFGAFASWLWTLIRDQALPGAWATIVVGQIALALTGIIAFFGFGLIVRGVAGRFRYVGFLGLVILRSFPEYMLAYLFLQVFGPSMLPAVLALAIHNGAIIAHLLGREAEHIPLRPDAPHGITLWGWELAPRMFGRFVALCLYRWEIILRETAVMGILGVMTLGFFIDDAVSELRLDRALVLLIVTGAITAGADRVSRAVRRQIGFDRDVMARPQGDSAITQAAG